jgi:LacI family transcriptional regulator
MVTVKDVALRAGVSMITVSRVVNGSNLVGQSTRLKVEEAIRELNYIPNSVASNLRSRQSDIIGLVVPDITSTFWTSIARGVEDEAWTRGYSVFICNTDEDSVKERAYVDKLLQRRVDGVLIVPSTSTMWLFTARSPRFPPIPSAPTGTPRRESWRKS